MIEELVLIEFVWLHYHAPAVPVGVVVEQIWIILDLPIQFHDLARKRRIYQECLDFVLVAGGEGNQQVLRPNLVTGPHDLREVIIGVLSIGVAFELAIVLRASEYYPDDVAVLSTDEFADSDLHRVSLVIQGLKPKMLQCVPTIMCDAEFRKVTG
ncbi:uncharacterized protein METZ01_LOCUS161402 [marine metagenome]|uniref:Uncharacterized protein n=1 Tax=marine metagenome TaxID=408172 RepID=A0A382B464_9ZZZZ